MTRHAVASDLLARAGLWSKWCLTIIGAVMFFLAGCMSTSSQHRAQSAEETETQRYDIPTVADRTTVGNAVPINLGGVGLVEGLEGTGGDCAHDSYRAMLAETLRKAGIREVEKLLRSPNHALVIVEAQLHPGASKNERFDVDVKLPPGSRATSLRGGTLKACYLYNYDFTHNLRPDYQGSQSLVMGHKLALAQGSILVGAGENDESSRAKQGRIWSGARSLKDNPLALVMNPDSQRGAITNLIAERINTAFPTGLGGPLHEKMAYTKDNMVVSIRVPAQYRLNIPRYLRVVRMIPLADSANQPGKSDTDRRSYRQKLTDDLLDPTRTVVAALRLEALGQNSIQTLKLGLKSPHTLVRFCSAEALAYLGSAACGEELYKAAAESPLLRAYALTALASLDEAICHLKLKDLIHSDLDDETRYGAFRALRSLSENDPVVRGERLNDSFWLHRVAPNTRPLVHLSTTKRAEIVLFGETPQLKPPFSFLAGEFAVTAAEGDNRCTVSRFPLRSAPARRQCSLELQEVLKLLAELGAQYPEVMTIMQQAGTCESLTCRIRVDAIPQAPSVHELMKAGQDASELLPAGQDLGQTPDLYQANLSRK